MSDPLISEIHILRDGHLGGWLLQVDTCGEDGEITAHKSHHLFLQGVVEQIKSLNQQNRQ